MNRFRTKRRAKEAAEQQRHRPQQQSPPPPQQPHHHGRSDAPPMPSLPFIKGKKKQPEPKPEVDLSTALPSSDDFRTSLLMPKLSARFSMLRDQDDPNSKMGKANDDSVLAPRRQSQLKLFGHSSKQLTDIAEVSSVAGSPRPSLAVDRPSFASADDHQHPVDDNSSQDTSIMNRSRPLEGNNLFGGRQKVYKIPVGGVNGFSKPEEDSSADNETGAANSGVANGGMGGRVVYENDVTMSPFQKQKLKEREQREAEAAAGMNVDADTRTSARASPPDEKNNTNNNLNDHGPDQRTSASTALSDSQDPTTTQESAPNTPLSGQHPMKPEGIERRSSKTRLYGQGLELRRKRSSAINRIENLNRQRSATNDVAQMNRSMSKSAANLADKYQQKTSPLYASHGFRPTSPPPSATSSISGHTDISGNNNNINGKKTNSGASTGHSFLAPVSPPVSETGEISPFAAALQPEDHGKATATGLFNKPASKYDEAQFSQRQLMMYEGRNTPPSRPSPSRAHSGPDSISRSRQLSNASSHQSGVDSAPSRQSESQEEPRRSGDRSASGSVRGLSSHKPTSGTFLADFAGSESDDDGRDGEDNRSVSSSVPSILHGSESVHPVLRNSTESGASSTYKSPHVSTPEIKPPDSRDLKTIEENETGENAQPHPNEIDSPTLGPSAPSAALGGLIRSQLRPDSVRTSFLPPTSPALAPAATESHRERDRPDPNGQTTQSPSHYAGSVHSNPFEYDDWTKESRTDSPEPAAPAEAAAVRTQTTVHPDMPNMMNMRAKQMLGQAEALSARGQTENHQPLSRSEGKQNGDGVVSTNAVAQQEQEDAVASAHNRAASAETQMDREEFANELAERRRRVQEKLRNVESSAGGAGAGAGGGGAMSHRFQDRGLGKNGSGPVPGATAPSPKPRADNNAQPKHLRLLGVDSSAISATPNLPTTTPTANKEKEPLEAQHETEKAGHQDRGWQTRQWASSPVGAHSNGNQQSHSHPPHQPRPQATPRSSRDDGRQHESSPATARDDTSTHTRKSEWRDRSGSESSGRSKSRPKYLDELESVEETIESQLRSLAGEATQAGAPAPSIKNPSYSVPSSARPSLDSSDRTYSGGHSVSTAGGGGGGRLRSNSRPTHLDTIPDPSSTHGAHPAFVGNSPRPSPVAPYSANTTPPLFETSPTSSPASTPGVHANGSSTSIAASSHHHSHPHHHHGAGSQQRNQGLAGHRRPVDKSQISEPTLVSSTNNVPTVGLPPGASLSNGSSSPSPAASPAPPVPPMNPRRRQTAAHTFLGNLKGSSSHASSSTDIPSSVDARHHTEHSTFSDEEKHPRPRTRQRLRKISSEGGNLNAKARQQAFRAESPAMPPVPKDGGMF